jgi:uncharacterized protein YmfQ (DUF2313 family)
MAYECVVLGDDPPSAADRLSAPAADDLLPAILADHPRGRAWQSDGWEQPLGTTVMHRFWRAVAGEIAEIYRAAAGVALDSTVVTASDEAVAEWEMELGLPEPCFDPTQDLASRRLMARLKRIPGGASAAFFVCLAGRYGIAISIDDDFRPWECGRSGCGGPYGLQDDPHLWRVTLEQPGTTLWFEAGHGEAGRTPLGSAPRRADLECLFRRLKPAHTNIVFRYLEGLVLDGTALGLGDVDLILTTDSET